MNNKTVAVALSGGLDSSVAAFLLKKEGYNVIGVTARTTNTAEADAVLENAENIAKKLEIPFYPFDAVAIFKDKVLKYFENSYKSGKTPNPCIMCNKFVKWGALFEYALNVLNADLFATGHYANIKNVNGVYKLYPASDEHKDQLYFLFDLNQEQLKQTIFPLSLLKKDEVRKIAEENNLPSKSAKESQDICFIKPPLTTKKYLNNILKSKTGDFIEKKSGKKLGEHQGFWNYTIGQRKGIGIAAPEALYVIEIDAEKNIVYVGYKDELYSKSLLLKNVNWSYYRDCNSFEALVKIRYNMQAIPAKIEILDNTCCNIEFFDQVSAISKGQACVLYDSIDGHLLGGGFI